MIYLQQGFDVEPASPAGLERFVELASSMIVPGWERAGGRLIGAWFGNEQWFHRATHVFAFEDLASFDTARAAVAGDAALVEARAEAEALAPTRSETLLEPLGPIAPAALDAAIARAADDPAGVYSLAILEVAPGKLEQFRALLAGAAPRLPILAAWRDVAGNPSRVVDLWRGDPAGQPYQPNGPALDAFFGPLREVAPREHTLRLFPLPYSPLR